MRDSLSGGQRREEAEGAASSILHGLSKRLKQLCQMNAHTEAVPTRLKLRLTTLGARNKGLTAILPSER